MRKRYFISYLILLNFIMLGLSSSIKAFDLSDHYKADSDHDGIIDIYDQNPNEWDVSDRDLRFFMELIYRDPAFIKDIFNNNQTRIDEFNRDKLNSAADIREMINDWQFVKYFDYEKTSGFFAGIFKNANQLIVAIRGTNNAVDNKSNISIAFGARPAQVDHLKEVKDYLVSNYPDSKYYLTGHSLGGYLSAYLASDSSLLYNDARLIHAAIFNAPGIPANLFSGSTHRSVASNNDRNTSLNSPKFKLADKRFNLEKYKFQPYGIHGDVINGIDKYENTRWSNSLNDSNKHSSTNFVSLKKDPNFRNWFSNGYRLDKAYLNLDSDNDGISDIDELHIGTDYLKLDSDNDGFGYLIELFVSSNPLDQNQKPKLSDLYIISATGGLNLNKRSELNEELVKSKVISILKEDLRKYDKQAALVTQNVNYQLLDYPDDISKAGYNFKVRVKGLFADGSESNIINIPIKIEENKIISATKINELKNYETLIQEIYQNDSIDFKNSFKALDEGVRLELLDEFDSSIIKEHDLRIRIHYPKGGSKVYHIKVKVLKRKENISATEIYIEPAYDKFIRTYYVNEKDIDPKESFRKLPNNTVVSFVDKIDSSKAGEFTYEVKLNFDNKLIKHDSITIKFIEKEIENSQKINLHYDFAPLANLAENFINNFPKKEIEDLYKPKDRLVDRGLVFNPSLDYEVGKISFYDEKLDGHWLFSDISPKEIKSEDYDNKMIVDENDNMLIKVFFDFIPNKYNYHFKLISDYNLKIPTEINNLLPISDQQYVSGDIINTKEIDLSNLKFYDEINDGYWTFDSFAQNRLIIKKEDNIIEVKLNFNYKTYSLTVFDGDQEIKQFSNLYRNDSLAKYLSALEKEDDDNYRYEFIGYNDQKDGKGNFYSQNDTIQNDLILYAIFDRKEIIKEEINTKPNIENVSTEDNIIHIKTDKQRLIEIYEGEKQLFSGLSDENGYLAYAMDLNKDALIKIIAYDYVIKDNIIKKLNNSAIYEFNLSKKINLKELSKPKMEVVSLVNDEANDLSRLDLKADLYAIISLKINDLPYGEFIVDNNIVSIEGNYLPPKTKLELNIRNYHLDEFNNHLLDLEFIEGDKIELIIEDKVVSDNNVVNDDKLINKDDVVKENNSVNKDTTASNDKQESLKPSIKPSTEIKINFTADKINLNNSKLPETGVSNYSDLAYALIIISAFIKRKKED